MDIDDNLEENIEKTNRTCCHKCFCQGITLLLLLCVLTFIQSFVIYGYGISELNSAEYFIPYYTEGKSYDRTVISQQDGKNKTCDYMKHWFKDCIPMTSSTYWFLCSSLFSVGGLFGAFAGGPISDLPFIGRKWTVWGSTVLFIISCCLKCFFTNTWALLFGRILHGFAAGIGSTVVPIYIEEISPNNLKGFFGTSNQIATTFGIFVSQLISIFTQSGQWWRFLLGFPLIFAAFQIILIPFLPHSPKFLVEKGFPKTALRSLEKIRGKKRKDDTSTEDPNLVMVDEDVKKEFFLLVSSCTIQKHHLSYEKFPVLISTNASRSSLIVDERKEEEDDDDVMKILLKKKKRKKEEREGNFVMKICRFRTIFHLLVATAVQVIQQISGINAIMFYSTKVFTDMVPSQKKNNSSIPIILTMLTMFINMISVFPAAFFVEIMGRKWLLLIGTFFEIVTMLLVPVFLSISKYGFDNSGNWALFFSILTVLDLFVYIFFFEVSIGAIPWFLTLEMFTNNIKPYAQGIAVAVNWGGAFVVTLIFPFVQKGIGFFSFLVFVVLMIFAFFFLCCCLMETKVPDYCKKKRRKMESDNNLKDKNEEQTESLMGN